MIKLIRTRLFLARHLLSHFFKRIFLWQHSGLQRFHKSYASDHIFALTNTEHKTLKAVSQCTTCHLCDIACPRVNEPQVLAPSYLVQTATRSLTDMAYISNHSLPACEDCRICEQLCPQNIPITEMISFIKAHSGDGATR